MTKKSLLLAGMLAFATITVASAKSYEIPVFKRATAGNVALKAGDYMLKLRGSEAVFTPYRPSLYMWATLAGYGKPVTVPVEVKQADQKFSQTTITSTQNGDFDKIEIIDLGGTHTELEFGE